jgi:hypothetical protein
MAQIAKGQAVMTRRIARPFVAALAALGTVCFALGGAPAASPAQAQEKTPWYLPPPWVYPPQTGPKIRKLPGYYGHTYRNRSYGDFSTYCYGDCGYRLPGTVSTGGGVILKRPTVAVFDPDAYAIVPQQQYQPAEQAAPRRAVPAVPVIVPVRDGARKVQQPTFSLQHGVRIIRPTPPGN